MGARLAARDRDTAAGRPLDDARDRQLPLPGGGPLIGCPLDAATAPRTHHHTTRRLHMPSSQRSHATAASQQNPQGLAYPGRRRGERIAALAPVVLCRTRAIYDQRRCKHELCSLAHSRGRNAGYLSSARYHTLSRTFWYHMCMVGILATCIHSKRRRHLVACGLHRARSRSKGSSALGSARHPLAAERGLRLPGD